MRALNPNSQLPKKILLFTLMESPLKIVPAIFYQIFISHQMIAPQKYEMFFFHLQSSFRSRDIQVFVFSSSPLFLLSAIALKVDPRKILKFMMSSFV